MPGPAADAAERPGGHLLQADDRRPVGGDQLDHLAEVAARPSGAVLPRWRFQARTSIGLYCTKPCASSIADPPAYTPWYDHELASALARAGAVVEVATSRFRFSELPPPLRLPARRALLSALVAALPALARAPAAEGASSTRACSARCRRGSTDVLHVQWLALPQADAYVRFRSPSVFTAHDLLPRRTAEKRDALDAAARALRPRRRPHAPRPRHAARPRRRGARDPAPRLPERGRAATTTGRRCSRSA